MFNFKKDKKEKPLPESQSDFQNGGTRLRNSETKALMAQRYIDSTLLGPRESPSSSQEERDYHQRLDQGRIVRPYDTQTLAIREDSSYGGQELQSSDSTGPERSQSGGKRPQSHANVVLGLREEPATGPLEPPPVPYKAENPGLAELHANLLERKQLRSELKQDVHGQSKEKLGIVRTTLQEMIEEVTKLEEIMNKDGVERKQAELFDDQVISTVDTAKHDCDQLQKEHLALQAHVQDLEFKYKKVKAIYFEQLNEHKGFIAIKQQRDDYEKQLSTIRDETEEKTVRQRIEYEDNLRNTVEEKDNKIAQISRDYQRLLDKSKAQELLRGGSSS